MIRTLQLLMRSHQAQAAEALEDACALTILDQHVRDAAADVAAARRALALSMARASSEERRMGVLRGQLADLEARALAALKGGRQDLAEEAAATMAALENEMAGARRALDALNESNRTMRERVEGGERRLLDLDRGRRSAQTMEAIHRLQGDIALRRLGALSEGEARLERLQVRQFEAMAALGAEEWLEGRTGASAVSSKLEAEGFGPTTRATAATVLNRLKTIDAADTAERS